jgi:hypothetical protein
MDHSLLQRERLRYTPTLPDCLAAGNPLLNFTVEDGDTDKQKSEEEEDKDKDKDTLAEKQQQQLEQAGEGAGTAANERFPLFDTGHYVGVVAAGEALLTPAEAADAADAARAAAPPPRRHSAPPATATTTTTTTTTSTTTTGGAEEHEPKKTYAGVTAPTSDRPAPPHLDLWARGGPAVDLAESFPHTAATPLYRVVSGPAVGGDPPGLAATERVRPIRTVRPDVFAFTKSRSFAEREK